MINWLDRDQDWTMTTTNGVQADYGWFHVYAFTMTLGMILAILYSFYKFYKKGLSFDSLIWGVILIIPASLFGASFFGKLNAGGSGINANGVGFWGLFAFWEAGMSIHGGVLFGLIVGLLVFGIIGRKTKVSLWAYVDAIVPNILLGQVAGRWGNFFNHELVGAPIRILGKVEPGWVPPVGLTRFDSLGIGNPWQGNALDWIWKNTSAVYTGNDTTINGLHLTNGTVVQMQPIFLIESISLLAVWLLITFVIPNIGKWVGPKPWSKAERKALGLFKSHKLWDAGFVNNVDQKAVETYELYKKSPDYLREGRWKRGQKLIKANNPNRYWITKVGCEGCAYFFGWNLVRFCLEMSRPDNHLFVMYNKPLSLAIIGGCALIGLIGMIVTQIGMPQVVRKEGWVYEKPYFIVDTYSALPTSKPKQTKTFINFNSKPKQISNEEKMAKAAEKMRKRQNQSK